MPQVETSDPQKSAQNTALFVQCVTMYAQQAMIAMGKLMNPVTNKAEKNLEAARFFIDMLEMLEAKTKGNISREEERLLQSSLGSVRLTFVEEIDTAKAGAEAKPASESLDDQASGKPEATPETKAEPRAEPPKEEESRKKFTKKYE